MDGTQRKRDGLLPEHVTWVPQTLRVHCVYELFGNLINHRYVSATGLEQAQLCECIVPPQQDLAKVAKLCNYNVM